jgi:hypothetical protein
VVVVSCCRYSCYDGFDESAPTNNRKVLILGGGPNRIGQGIEFDYCCCHASFALRWGPACLCILVTGLSTPGILPSSTACKLLFLCVLGLSMHTRTVLPAHGHDMNMAPTSSAVLHHHHSVPWHFCFCYIWSYLPSLLTLLSTALPCSALLYFSQEGRV